MPDSVKDPKEAAIERNVSDYAKGAHMLSYKFTSPNRRSVPDRLFITSRGTVFFIEFKRKGKAPTDAQYREIRRIASFGVRVFIVDNIDKGRSIIDEMSKF